MIRLEELQIRAGDFALAVDDLSIAAGEYVMVLGPTASGKTVLLETVAGLRRPHGGRVWFGERDVTTEPPERRGAGLVYQDYALFPHLTVAANIGFGPRVRKERVRELAGLLGIDGLLDRYPDGLSGGEQQRVALARALAIEPEVLLLDEPLSALDGPTRLELQRELRRVHKDFGATVMHVTHDLDEALALGDRVAVLVAGELRQVDAPQHVTRYPVDVEVARLVGMTNVFAVTAGAGVDGGPRGGDGDGRIRRVRLENGRELVCESSPPAPSSPLRFAVIRAEEIEVQPLGDRMAQAAYWPNESGSGDRTNEMEGTVRSVQIQSVHASIEVEVPPPAAATALAIPTVFTAHVLRPQVEKLGLTVGSRVLLRIPAPAVHPCADAVPSGLGPRRLRR